MPENLPIYLLNNSTLVLVHEFDICFVIFLNVPATPLKGRENDLLWQLTDCFQIDDKVKLAQKWQLLKNILPNLNTDINA